MFEIIFASTVLQQIAKQFSATHYIPCDGGTVASELPKSAIVAILFNEKRELLASITAETFLIEVDRFLAERNLL